MFRCFRREQSQPLSAQSGRQLCWFQAANRLFFLPLFLSFSLSLKLHVLQLGFYFALVVQPSLDGAELEKQREKGKNGIIVYQQQDLVRTCWGEAAMGL